MEKKLQDYIHLYPGCEVVTEEEREECKDVLPLGKRHDLHFFKHLVDAAKIINWFRERFFDVDGLIEAGLSTPTNQIQTT